MVRIKNLSYAFSSNWALQNISFSLDAGDFLFITGPSGAGKTTLLRILHASLPIRQGNAEVAGFDLKNLSPGKVRLLRRQVSLVFQDFKILPRRTVFENVALALEVQLSPREMIEKRVRAVLRALDLENKAQCLCDEISGGEQQRTAIARAFVTAPKLIMADEPTGNLDRELAWRLLEIFKHFHAHGTTVVFATHDAEFLELVPRAKIIQLAEGSVVRSNFPMDN